MTFEEEEGQKTTVRTSVAVENIEFLSDDDCDDETLLKNLQDLQKSTKSKISGLIQTVQEAKNVDTAKISSSQVEEKKMYMLASEEPSLEELKSETTIGSMSESNMCVSSCLLEKETSGSFSMTDSSLSLATPCPPLSDTQQHFTLTSELSPGRNIQLHEGNQDIGYLLYLCQGLATTLHVITALLWFSVWTSRYSVAHLP